MPALARCAAICAPIVPAPRTATRSIECLIWLVLDPHIVTKAVPGVNRKRLEPAKFATGSMGGHMLTVSNWLPRAIQGFRSFAYAGQGERPKVGLALGGG